MNDYEQLYSMEEYKPDLSYVYTTTSPPSTITINHGSTSTDWAVTSSNWSTNHHGSLDVRGNATFDGDVTIKGVNLIDTLNRIEEKLAIFKPNPELEEKWEQLRELRRQYMELEREIIEKENVWNILKK